MLTSLVTVCNNPVLDNAALALVSLQLCPIGGARTLKAKSTVPSGCRVDPRRAGTPGDRFATCRLYCSRITFYLPSPARPSKLNCGRTTSFDTLLFVN